MSEHEDARRWVGTVCGLSLLAVGLSSGWILARAVSRAEMPPPLPPVGYTIVRDRRPPGQHADQDAQDRRERVTLFWARTATEPGWRLIGLETGLASSTRGADLVEVRRWEDVEALGRVPERPLEGQK